MIKKIKIRKMNKKGQLSQLGTFNIFQFMILSFLCVVLFGGLIWISGTLNTTMNQVGVMNDKNPRTNFTFPCLNNQSEICSGSTYVNMTQASDATFGQMNQSIQSLRMVAIVYILSLAVCIIITNFLQKMHPLWFFAYMLIAMLAIIFAPTISNAYESLLNSGIYDGTLSSFTASNFILLNLPMIVMFISVIGGIGLFVNLLRQDGGNL